VFAFTWLGARIGLGRLPEGITWPTVLGLSTTAGVGFTVALFITGLAFTDAGLTNSAKIGIFMASMIAGTSGYFLLRASGSSASERELADRQG
jgi:NhaA family Na+:H+ antiporter